MLYLDLALMQWVLNPYRVTVPNCMYLVPILSCSYCCHRNARLVFFVTSGFSKYSRVLRWRLNITSAGPWPVVACGVSVAKQKLLYFSTDVQSCIMKSCHTFIKCAYWLFCLTIWFWMVRWSAYMQNSFASTELFKFCWRILGIIIWHDYV